MKRGLRIAGIVAAVVVLLFVALAVAVKLVVTPEGVRSTILPLVEKRLHRPVAVGGIDIGIFSGITLDGLTIRERDGQGEFLRARQLKLRYQFWPLLSKRVVVDELRLDAPSLRVVRLPDGTFNYSDITAKKEPPEAKPAEKGKVDLLVSKVSLTNGTVLFEDRKGERPFSYTISGIGFESKGVALDKPLPFTARASVPGAVITAEGQADVAKKPATVDVVVRLTETSLEKLVAGLPPQHAAKARAYAPSGAITARIHLAGETSAPKQLLKEGEVRLDGVQVTASGQRASLTGDIVLKGDSASSSNLRLTSGPNAAQISFTASNLTGKPLTVSSSITADRFDLDPFLKQGGSAPAAKAPADKPEPGPLNLPVKAAGTVQIGQTSWKGLPLTQLALKYRLADNVLAVEQLSGNVAGGSFSDTAQVDLRRKGFAYSSKLRVQGVQAAPVVAAFAPRAAGTVSGALSLTAEVGGTGTKSEAIKKNVSGRGDFTITDGKLTGAGLVQGLAQFLNVEELRVVQFSKFGGNFRIENGKVLLDSSVSGRDVQIAPKGTAGLDKTLDLSLATRLSPPITGRLGKDVRRFVTDDQGWGTLPLKVTGTFSSPKFRLDTSQIGGQLKTRAQEKLQKTIQEKVFKQKEGEPKRPEQELLERGFKGIFGK